MHAADPARPPAYTVVVLGLLTMFGPLSLDLYLPALPQLADDLGTSASAAQLSITACLVGLAVGQLVAGPLSDRLGRRRPLIVGLLAYVVASVACALAPSVMVLVALRLVQGLAGAAGIVISRAIARDLYSGRELMIFFSRLLLIAGLAPVVAPILGGQLSRIMSWRGIFGVLAGFGAVLLLAGWFGLRETLPPERRIVGGFHLTLQGYNTLVHDRFFVGCALSSGLAGASMFAYIAGSTFVLQRIYGMSPQAFSLVFGCISLGLVAAAQGGARLALVWPLTRVLALGLAINLTGATALLVTVVTGLPLAALIGAPGDHGVRCGIDLPDGKRAGHGGLSRSSRYRIFLQGPQPIPVRCNSGTAGGDRGRADRHCRSASSLPRSASAPWPALWVWSFRLRARVKDQ
jgi:DHA1 family bicyclomycin/chloramphenicol resistance-like MFS transporter